MKIVAIGTMKGGVGKTAITFNVCANLAQRGYKVLAIDADPQANLSDDAGIDINDVDAPSIVNIFNRSKQISNINNIINKNIFPEYKGQFDIVSSNIWLHLTEENLINRSSREMILSYYLEDNFDTIENYDYIIIDTNPSMSIVNRNAYYIADSIIAITDPNRSGINGVQLLDYLWNEKCEDLRIKNTLNSIIINKVNRTNLSKEFLEYCKLERADISEMIMDTTLPTAVKIAESEKLRKPITTGNEKQIFDRLVDELIEKGVL